jgi:hypothetical protein
MSNLIEKLKDFISVETHEVGRREAKYSIHKKEGDIILEAKLEVCGRYYIPRELFNDDVLIIEKERLKDALLDFIWGRREYSPDEEDREDLKFRTEGL